jgi:NAD(P)H-dependent flavin oxidoreductase YrpB (nitropropane dioxygenase family)
MAHPKRVLDRATAFAAAYGCEVPILLAPMAGACPPPLSIAVANAGGMGAMGALLHDGPGIAKWVDDFRAGSRGALQINTWVPDPPPCVTRRMKTPSDRSCDRGDRTCRRPPAT